MSLLQLPEFRELEMQESELDMAFWVEKDTPPSACPHCGCVANLYKHQRKEQVIMDLPVRAKRVGIYMQRIRYKCRDCNSTFWELIDCIDDKRKMTKRLVDHIRSQCFRKTFTDVSNDIGVDEKTIRNTFKDYTEELKETHSFVTPRVLGIDEIYVNGKPRLILTNVEERTIYDMVDNRKQENVIKRLDAIPDKETIEIVTMDMWAPYRRSVQLVVPHAESVIDKFHVVRMSNQALENVRKASRVNQTQAERKALKSDRKILLKRHHDLTEQGQFLVELWLSNHPDLRAAYDLKERFYRIWDCEDKATALETYNEWYYDLQATSPVVRSAFSDIPKAFSNWGEQIFSYFDNGFTNAYTESLNGIIRKIDQSGRGYSFDVLRAKLLYQHPHKVQIPSFSKKVFKRMQETQQENILQLLVTHVNYGVDISTLIKQYGLED